MGETLKRFMKTLKLYPRAVVILHWGDGLEYDEDGFARRCMEYWSSIVLPMLTLKRALALLPRVPSAAGEGEVRKAGKQTVQQ
jgi:hypothetical protein